jgi:hypothetical protein
LDVDVLSMELQRRLLASPALPSSDDDEQAVVENLVFAVG